MTTMITSECINCGACEPECPNNAISQEEDIYVIDPLLCTECVGFHDYEACAAVCPVDCCVTDPNNIEVEDALIARARTIHQDVDFGETFESRFRKGAEKPKAPTPSKEASTDQQTKTPPTASTTQALTTSPDPIPETKQPTLPTDGEDPSPPFLTPPEYEEWEIPVRCFKCNETYTAPVRYFMIGNVLFCPHCQKSTVVKDNLNFQIRTALKEFYERWEENLVEVQVKREKELREFRENREKELRDFQKHQEQELEKIKTQLRGISESYDAPGRPAGKRTPFGWG